MFTEYRAPSATSTPEMWADRFAAGGHLSLLKRVSFAIDVRWRLIQQWIPAGRILDAGCGAGEWVAFLQSRGRDAIGLDYAAAMVERNRARYPDFEWRTGDVEQLPYADTSLTGVVSWGVIEHREHGPLPALREFRRVLKPGGAAIVTVPLDSAVQRRATEIGDANRGEFFQYYMSPEELTDFVRQAGFEPVAVGTMPQACFALLAPRLFLRFPPRANQLAQGMTRLLLSGFERYRSMIYCVGRA